MDKTKLLQIMVVLLLALNLFILAMQFGPRLMGPKNGIQKHFGFDAEQVVAFEKSRDEIQEKLNMLNPQLRDASQAYYNERNEQLANGSLLMEVTQLNEQIYKAHHKHFEDIENICTDEQKKQIPEFIRKLMGDRERGKPGKPGKPGRR
jgi:hypothetical protein